MRISFTVKPCCRRIMNALLLPSLVRPRPDIRPCVSQFRCARTVQRARNPQSTCKCVSHQPSEYGGRRDRTHLSMPQQTHVICTASIIDGKARSGHSEPALLLCLRKGHLPRGGHPRLGSETSLRLLTIAARSVEEEEDPRRLRARPGPDQAPRPKRPAAIPVPERRFALLTKASLGSML